jgi:hypothetical protein
MYVSILGDAHIVASDPFFFLLLPRLWKPIRWGLTQLCSIFERILCLVRGLSTFIYRVPFFVHLPVAIFVLALYGAVNLDLPGAEVCGSQVQKFVGPLCDLLRLF